MIQEVCGLWLLFTSPEISAARPDRILGALDNRRDRGIRSGPREDHPVLIRGPQVTSPGDR